MLSSSDKSHPNMINGFPKTVERSGIDQRVDNGSTTSHQLQAMAGEDLRLTGLKFALRLLLTRRFETGKSPAYAVFWRKLKCESRVTPAIGYHFVPSNISGT
jgi:hypothetical protein